MRKILRSALVASMLGFLALPAATAAPGAPPARREAAAQPATRAYYQGSATEWQPVMTQPQVESTTPLVPLVLLALTTLLGLTIAIRALLDDIRQRRIVRRNWHRHWVDTAI